MADEGFEPVSFDGNGRAGRRCVVLVGKGGWEVRIFDLDFVDGEGR